MSSTTARARDLEFPNLRPEVVDAYRNASPGVVVEVIDGELFTMPRPRARHARAATRLAGRLAPFDDPGDDDPGGWDILIEPELHLGPRPDKMQPDLAGWLRERMPRVPRKAAIQVAPDWVCEVLSPSTASLDRDVKMPLYAEHGVSFAWLVDPIAQVLEAFKLVRGRWQPTGTWRGDDVVRVEPFDALTLDLTRLWPE